jgi:glycosyltransferase involved in cell wall biosynthesis
MRILLICEAVFPENKGGLERWMSWLGTELNRRGHEISYLNSSGIDATRDGVAFIPAGHKKWHYVNDGKRSIRQSLKFAIDIRSKVRKLNPDVIYSVQAPIFSVLSLGIWPGRKWLLIVEWIEIWSLKYWKNYLGGFFGTVGFILQYLATKVGDIRVVFSRRCLLQLGESNTANLQLSGLHMNSSAKAFPEYKFRSDILFLGRFVAEKQPLLAIQSVEKFRSMGWTGTFHIVGTGPLVADIRDEIVSRKMGSYVEVLENATQSELDHCFEKSFVLMHPSKREGYGLAMIEAAERGIPTILIDYPENASVDLEISPEYLSQNADPTSLAELLMKASSSQESDYSRLKVWTKEVLPKMNANKSVDELISAIVNRNS